MRWWESSWTEVDFFWLAIFIWLSVLSFFLAFLARRFYTREKGYGCQKLEKVVRALLSDRGKDQERIELNRKEIAVLEKQAKGFFQKMALSRYNPFNETGGNQSFSLALLDGENNGIVISSFHGREGTRLYTKQVIEGRTDDSFSREEKSAIKEAMKKVA
jgi:hypothetical protein